MKKEKITLNQLKIETTLTSLNDRQMKEVKGGATSVRGRRHTYTTRWTSVDTRIDPVHDNGPMLFITTVPKG